MARTKLTTPKIMSLGEADQTLAEIARLQREIDTIQSTMNDRIDTAKASAREQAQPLQAQIKTLGEALGAYATYHKNDLFKKQKTMEANHGRYGFRKSTSLKPLPKLKWADVLAKVKELGRTNLLRVKEDVNREALRELTEADMDACGVRLVSQDEFWYEIDQEDVESVA